MSGAQAPATAVEDFGRGDAGIAARWITELDLAEKETRDWHTRCNLIEKRYRDDRATVQAGARRGGGTYRFNVLWSNVQTLMPAIYARPPKPVVGRRHRDRDPIGRAASQIVERGLDYNIECQDLHNTVKLAVQDFLLPGRGQVWLRYEPQFAGAIEAGQPVALAGEAPENEEAQLETDPDKPNLAYEQVECDYVHWSDFQCAPARIWKEVRWVARRFYLTRAELRERFESLTEAEINVIPLDWKPLHFTESDVSPEHQAFARATVWEIWNKDDRRVYWIAPGYTAGPLDMQDDPLKLEGFFPCPRPLLATTTNGTIVPVPDYTEYQDQADQLDDLTGRIALVTRAIKVTGLYPAEAKDVARIFQEGSENMLLAVDNWAAFIDKGGLEKMIALMPVDMLAKVLRDLTEIRNVVKNDLYEITGIADIVRGSTKPNETATAQQIKGRYATMRLSDKQQEVARFVRDVLRMMGEIMCEHFSPSTLLLMSDYDQSGDSGLADMQQQAAMGQQIDPAKMQAAMLEQQKAQQKIVAAIELLKNDKIRGFRIDIEDESTIAQDDMEQKQARLEFLTATSGFLKEAVPAAQAVPELGPLLGKMLLFGVRAFRSGRDMETSIEDALAQLEKAQAAAAAQPKPPSPEQMKAEAEAQKAQADLAMSQQQAEADGMKGQVELEIRRLEMEAKERSEQRAHEFAMADLELKARQQDAADRKVLLDERNTELNEMKAAHEMGMRNREVEKEDGAEAQTADTADRMDKRDQALLETVATIAQGHDAIVSHLKSLSAPRRVVRGPDGRVQSVVPVEAA